MHDCLYIIFIPLPYPNKFCIQILKQNKENLFFLSHTHIYCTYSTHMSTYFLICNSPKFVYLLFFLCKEYKHRKIKIDHIPPPTYLNLSIILSPNSPISHPPIILIFTQKTSNLSILGIFLEFFSNLIYISMPRKLISSLHPYSNSWQWVKKGFFEVIQI